MLYDTGHLVFEAFGRSCFCGLVGRLLGWRTFVDRAAERRGRGVAAADPGSHRRVHAGRGHSLKGLFS